MGYARLYIYKHTLIVSMVSTHPECYHSEESIITDTKKCIISVEGHHRQLDYLSFLKMFHL